MKRGRPKSQQRPRGDPQPQEDLHEDDIMAEEARVLDEDPYSKIKPGA